MFKFRFALIEWPSFSRIDDVVFNVRLQERGGMRLDVPVELFESESLDAGRARAHALVDKYFDHKSHMEQLEKMSAEHKRRFAAEAAEIANVTELVISRVDPKAKKKVDSDLIDLMGDVNAKDESEKYL